MSTYPSSLTVAMISILLGFLIVAQCAAEEPEPEAVPSFRLPSKCVDMQRGSNNASVVALIGRNTDIHTLLSTESSFLKSSFSTKDDGLTVKVSGETLWIFCSAEHVLLVPPSLDRIPSSGAPHPVGDLPPLSFTVAVADVIIYVADDNIRQTDVELLSLLAVQKHYLSDTRKQTLVVTMQTTRRHIDPHRWHIPITSSRKAHSPAQQLRAAFAVHTIQSLSEASSQYMRGLLKKLPGTLNKQSAVHHIAQEYADYMQGSEVGMVTIPTLRSRAMEVASEKILDDLYDAVDKQLLDYFEIQRHRSDDRLLQVTFF